MSHNFSSPRKPNKMVLLKKSLEKMARMMLIESVLAKSFWGEDVNNACYIFNRALIKTKLNKTPYELPKDRKPNIIHFLIFGCKCFVHNNKENQLDEFDPKSDEVILLDILLIVKHTRC